VKPGHFGAFGGSFRRLAQYRKRPESRPAKQLKARKSPDKGQLKPRFNRRLTF
jgi:hypothetical protein